MELVVFDFNIFGTDNKFITLEDLLRYCDSFTVMSSCNLRNLFLEVLLNWVTRVTRKEFRQIVYLAKGA